MARIFFQPTLEALLALSPSNFEQFVGYVFTRAGYLVEDASTQYGLGIDLKLHVPRQAGGAHTAQGMRPHAYIQVKRLQPKALVGSPTVLGFMGSLALGWIPGYLVTTSDFTRPAYTLAARRAQCSYATCASTLRGISSKY